MDRDHRARRSVLAGVAGLLTVGTAGCSLSPATDGDADQPSGPDSTDPPDPTAESGRVTSLSNQETVTGTPGSMADRYVDVYQTTIGSVTQIQVYGRRGRGSGAGWLYDDRHVVTNEHVVAGTDDVYTRFPDGTWNRADVVGTDVYSDLAVLRVADRPSNARPLTLDDADPPVGTEVVAIGNPFGFSGSVSAGIVSGVDRTLPAPNNFSIPDAIQTDAPVNPGNSGGPLVGLDGNVVGVINSGGGDNLGFAISAALTRRVIPALIDTGEYEHSYMGIRLRPVGPLVAIANDIDRPAGVYVDEVVSGTPSDGVFEGSTGTTTVDGTSDIPVGGDVIVRMGDTPITERQALSTFLALETQPGDTVPVTVLRDGSEQTVELTLGARPEP